MLRLAFFISLGFFCSCTSESRRQSNQENFKQAISDTANKEYKLTARFNSFDTSVEVLFWDTKDTFSNIQKLNYEGFISKQDILTPIILQKIFEFYKTSYPDYLSGWKAAGKISDKELEKFLPKPTNPEGLKPFITPAIIHIQNKEDCKEGTLGIEFDCTWDIENGLGIKIENWKVIEAGVAETSYFFNEDIF